MSTETQGAPTGDVNAPTSTPTESYKSQVQAEEIKTPDPAAEGDDGTTPTDEGAEGDKPKPKRADGGFQRRINRLTADYRTAEARAEAAERRARELEGKLTQPAKDETDPKPPRLDDFKSYEDYEAAKEEFVADKTRRETLRTLETARKQDEAKKAETEQRDRMTKARERFEANAEKVAEHYEDFDEVIDDFYKGRSPLKNFDQAALEFVFEGGHDRGPELVFHLHTNEDVAKRIASMRPVQQVAELARLEASLAKPGAKTVTKAPAPPRSVGAKGGPDGKDPDKMTYDELRKATKTERIVDY